MRIIGGQRRGLKLADIGPGDPAAHLRPTSDRVREAIFNLLVNGGHGNRVAGARVLDIFAGTGALGLEALSRGAEHATFVENGRTALTLLARNIALMRAEGQCTVLRQDATRPDASAHAAAADLVFLDPPYGKGMGEHALATALQRGWIAPGALIVWEEGAALPVPAPFELCDRRQYGDTVVTILEARTPGRD